MSEPKARGRLDAAGTSEMSLVKATQRIHTPLRHRKSLHSNMLQGGVTVS